MGQFMSYTLLIIVLMALLTAIYIRPGLIRMAARKLGTPGISFLERVGYIFSICFCVIISIYMFLMGVVYMMVVTNMLGSMFS